MSSYKIFSIEFEFFLFFFYFYVQLNKTHGWSFGRKTFITGYRLPLRNVYNGVWFNFITTIFFQIGGT